MVGVLTDHTNINYIESFFLVRVSIANKIANISFVRTKPGHSLACSLQLKACGLFYFTSTSFNLLSFPVRSTAVTATRFSVSGALSVPAINFTCNIRSLRLSIL